MGDPNYIYRPKSPKQRRAAAAAARKRLGIPPGHRRLYGVHLPEELYLLVKRDVLHIARKNGREDAERVTKMIAEIHLRAKAK